MRKITAFLLSVLMLCSLQAFSASAQAETDKICSEQPDFTKNLTAYRTADAKELSCREDWYIDFYSNDEYIYDIDRENDTVTLFEYIGSDENVVVPGEILGKKVDFIASGVFAYCDFIKIPVCIVLVYFSKNPLFTDVLLR